MYRFRGIGWILELIVVELLQSLKDKNLKGCWFPKNGIPCKAVVA
jgi:hypothetical protein